MNSAKLWFIFSLVLLFAVGTVSFSFAAPQQANAAKTHLAKASAAEPTRDTRTLFGYDIEGLEPVTISYVSDGAFNSLGDALLVSFKKIVETESKGKIRMDAHRHGSLYRTNDFPKVISIGTVDMGSINKGLLMSREPEFAPWIIGYVWKSPEHIIALTASPEWYALEDKLAKPKWNMKPIVNLPIGNGDYWATTEIKGMNDFSGKQVWSYGELSNAYISAWGGTPVMKSVGEMYMSYHKGALNAVSFNAVGYHDYKFYESGKYWLHMPTYPPGSVGIHYVQLYMNLDKWNKLPVPYKRIILDAADMLSWVGTWESLCMEKLTEFRLMNQHKVVDVGISTKYPIEYAKIKAAAVEAGRKYTFSKGVTQQQWDEAQMILAKYADPKLNAKYSWWYKLAWAESDRRMAEVKEAIAAGKSWDEAFEPFHPKRQYSFTYEQLRKEWDAVPRVMWDWPLEARLK